MVKNEKVKKTRSIAIRQAGLTRKEKIGPERNAGMFLYWVGPVNLGLRNTAASYETIFGTVKEMPWYALALT